MSRRRGAMVFVAGLCMLGAACSSSAKRAPPVTTTSASSTTTSTSPTVATGVPTTAVAVTAPPTTTIATIATTIKESVFVVSVDLAAHTITVDPMEFLTGRAATAAYRKAYPGATENTPPNDYYIVNPTKDHLTLPLETGAVVRVVEAGGTVHTDPVPVPQAELVNYAGLGNRPFWITVERGAVTEVDEQFVP